LVDQNTWCEWKRGYPLTKNTLANLLKPFGIKSKRIRIGGGNQRGYEKTAFEDAFVRYLQSTPIQNGTVEQVSNHGACGQFKNGTTGVSVPLSKTLQTNNQAGCSTVPLQEGGNREPPSIFGESGKIPREVSEL